YWHICLVALFVFSFYGCSTNPTKESDPVDSYDNLYRGSNEHKTANEAAIAAETPEEAIARGDEAYAKRQYDIALYEYVEALQLSGGDTETLNKVGDIHFTLGDLDSAEQAYNASIQLDEENQHALQGLGLIQLRQRNYDEAKASLIEALSLNPDLWNAHNGLGMIADIEGDHTTAIEYYRRALQLNPRSPQVLNNLGYSEYLSGNWHAAMMHFVQAVNSNPDYDRAWYNIGLIYTREGDYENAFDAFRNVLDTPQSYNDIGYLNMIDGHYDIAEYYFQKAVKTSPSYYLKAHENIDKLERLRERGPATRQIRKQARTTPATQFETQTSNSQDTVIAVSETGIPVVKVAAASSSAVVEITSAGNAIVADKKNAEIMVESSAEPGATQRSSLAELDLAVTPVTPKDQTPEPVDQVTETVEPPETDKTLLQAKVADDTASSIAEESTKNITGSTTAIPDPVTATDPVVSADSDVAGEGTSSESPANSVKKDKSYTYGTQGEQAEYRRALAMVRDGQFEEAAESFNIFLQTYPESSYADNASYWIGETYYVTRDFEPALETFTVLIEKYPDSPKVPDTRLKIGYIHYEQHDWSAAREVLSNIVTTYPDTEVAQLANARLNRMEDEAH
ncbi:MAG: tol-pal system protein YbgF, partial [Gammaproteobacteria bacterium]